MNGSKSSISGLERTADIFTGLNDHSEGVVKKVWIAVVMGTAMLGVAGLINFSSGAKASAGPIVVEDIQYPFEKGGGLVHVAVEDVFMGVGMLTGEQKKEETQVLLTGSVNFEGVSEKTQARIQVDGIRLIERTSSGQDARVFEPARISDESMEKGLEPELQFPKGKGKLPFVWENGERDCVFFVFKDVPADVTKADLVITYNGKFLGKKHVAYYEDRLSVKRKSYLRNR